MNAKAGEYYSNKQSTQILKYVPLDVRRVLEFGCGNGEFCNLVKSRNEAEYWGVQINTQAAKDASKKLYRVINADAVAAINELPNDYLDCIIFDDVPEHLVDPFSLLISVKAKLTQKGPVVASIPNVRSRKNLKQLIWHGEWEYVQASITDNIHLRSFTYKSLVATFLSLRYDINTIENIRPATSRSFKRWNYFLLNRLWDARYMQFACVITPKKTMSTQTVVLINKPC